VRRLITALALSTALMASPALAQALRAGATVTDPQGGTVGTITAIDGANVVLRTDRHEVRLPAAAFTATADAVLFGATRDQLNADVDRLQAEAQRLFAVGTPVRDRDGAAVGPVQALDEQSVTVQLAAGLVRLPRAAFAPSNGALVTGASLAELTAAATPSAPAGAQ
jgi:hypothetical protein